MPLMSSDRTLRKNVPREGELSLNCGQTTPLKKHKLPDTRNPSYPSDLFETSGHAKTHETSERSDTLEHHEPKTAIVSLDASEEVKLAPKE